METERTSSGPAYRLDQLGWLQFERLCSLVLDAEADLGDVTWSGHADTGRVAVVDGPVVLAGRVGGLPGPVTLAVVWVPEQASMPRRLRDLVDRTRALAPGRGSAGGLVVLTNLDGSRALGPLAGLAAARDLLMLGPRELGDSVDRHPGLRSAMPSVLGLRDLRPLIPADVRARSTFDIESAQALARVFSPTRAFARARTVVARHRFVVLTGPPEMGKTAIARMIALAQLTDGWEAHECRSPDQVWSAYAADRPQVFVADDAFGSTEYRPDSAERWARELGRLLAVLDDRHWLIWTSRPAPLKAGLRRVQRERGSERFPSPGEVLVDAGDLDLSEKTLILFRHAKDRRASGPARRLVRAAGVAIVEHPHFTPERIRRFAAERLDQLPAVAAAGDDRVLELVELELACPTEAMGASLRALEPEHCDLLTAMLDVPAGLIDERELAATVRRHHPGGLSRAPAELIDRLTDHFLRITPLGIGWVHPSWRDLVIDELRGRADDRRRFLRSCGIDGAMLVLSHAGGAGGERTLPLLTSDADWDLFGDRVRVLLGDLEDRDVARLLVALGGPLDVGLAAGQRVEVESLAGYALGATRRAWDDRRRPLALFLLDAWLGLNARLTELVRAPALGPTWAELHPARGAVDVSREDLARADEWLALAELLAEHDAGSLAALGFPARKGPALRELVKAAAAAADSPEADARSLAASIVRRIRVLAPAQAASARVAGARLAAASPAVPGWWAPADLDVPPTDEPAGATRERFSREDVDRVLSDL